jgi:hypothetical protein
LSAACPLTATYRLFDSLKVCNRAKGRAKRQMVYCAYADADARKARVSLHKLIAMSEVRRASAFLLATLTALAAIYFALTRPPTMALGSSNVPVNGGGLMLTPRDPYSTAGRSFNPFRL